MQSLKRNLCHSLDRKYDSKLYANAREIMSLKYNFALTHMRACTHTN